MAPANSFAVQFGKPSALTAATYHNARRATEKPPKRPYGVHGLRRW